MDFSLTEDDHKLLVSQTRKVIDICFQRTISLENFIQVRNAPIFILRGEEFSPMTLEKIVQVLDLKEQQAVHFLVQNQHLMDCDTDRIYHLDQKEVLTRNYAYPELALDFLMSQKRSGALHHSFRHSAIKTWTELVVKLVEGQDTPLSDEVQ